MQSPEINNKNPDIKTPQRGELFCFLEGAIPDPEDGDKGRGGFVFEEMFGCEFEGRGTPDYTSESWAVVGWSGD